MLSPKKWVASASEVGKAVKTALQVAARAAPERSGAGREQNWSEIPEPMQLTRAARQKHDMTFSDRSLSDSVRLLSYL